MMNFLSEEEKEEEHEVSKRKTSRVKSKIVKVSEPAREEPTPGCSTQDVDSVQSEEDMEISFNVSNRNKSNSESPKRLRLSDFADECEILQTSSDEEASMRRFAIFLEKNGYIKKVDKKDTVEEKSSQATSKMTPNRKNREGQKEKGKRKVDEKLLNEIDDQGSELTIYRAAVEMDLSDKEIGSGNSSDNSKRLSSSSEEMNSSGEVAGMQLISEVQNQVTEENKSEKTIGDKEQILYQQFIDCRLREQRTQAQDRHGRSDSQPQPGTSYQQHHKTRRYEGHQELDAKEKARKMIQQAEVAKAKMFQVPGNVNNQLVHSVLVDEEYAIVGSHLEESLRRKIVCHEYMDFSRLLPRDRIVREADKRLEIVHKDGQTFFRPVSERESGGITGLYKWDQAFRIFSSVYTEVFAHRASELLQYSHIIHHTSHLFTWDNIYAYDIDFRLHMSKHPERSWGIILQQAWSMQLQDRIGKPSTPGQNALTGSKTPGSNNNKKICRKYNQGKCTYGFNCKFDHRCGICSKSGHGAHICRKGNSGERYNRGNGNQHHHSGNSHNSHRDCDHKRQYEKDEKKDKRN